MRPPIIQIETMSDGHPGAGFGKTRSTIRYRAAALETVEIRVKVEDEDQRRVAERGHGATSARSCASRYSGYHLRHASPHEWESAENQWLQRTYSTSALLVSKKAANISALISLTVSKSRGLVLESRPGPIERLPSDSPTSRRGASTVAHRLHPPRSQSTLCKTVPITRDLPPGPNQ